MSSEVWEFQCSHFREAQPEKEYTSNLDSTKSVVVIPFNRYLSQIEAATKVEMMLVNYGFNVKPYQIDVKDVERRVGAGAASVDSKTKNSFEEAAIAAKNEITIERFKEYESVSVDMSFEVLTNSNMVTVKVINTKDKAVIGVASFQQDSPEDFETFLVEKMLLKEKR